MTYRDGQSRKMLFSILGLIATVLVAGCATQPITSHAPINATQSWHRSSDGNYKHVSGRVVSEEEYSHIIADDVRNRFNRVASKVPKNCKRKIQY